MCFLRDSHYKILFALLILLALMFCGCSAEQDNTRPPVTNARTEDLTPRSGGVYRSPLGINPSTLDPAYIEDMYGVSVAYQLYDCLLKFGPYLSVMPAIAESWQIEDNGKLIVFNIRPEVYFHHGRRLTSKDVIFTLKRLMKVAPAPSILPHLLKIKGSRAFRDNLKTEVAGLNRIDDRRFSLRLLEPHAPLLSALAMYQAAIVPEDVVSRQGNRFGESPVGCGPFRFVEWKDDQTIVLERFEQYYAGPAYLDRIHYRIFPGVGFDQILKEFKQGHLDEMPVYGNIRNHLADMNNLQWVHRPSLSLLFYGFNTNHPQMKDPQLRRALSLAIDRADLVDSVYKGQFEPAYSVLPPGMPGHNRDSAVVYEDVAAAKKLVNDILPVDSNRRPVVEIASASQSAFAKAEFAFVKKAWEPLGIETRIKYITDWSEFEAHIESGSMQLYRYAWTADMPDPDNFMNPLFGSDSPVNYTRFNRPEIDLMLKEAAAIVDPVQRAQRYQQIEEQVMQAYPIIPLFYLSIDRVYQPDVKGINVSALGAQAVRLHRVWLSANEG